MSEKRGETFVMRDEPDATHDGKGIGFTPFLLGLASSALIHLGVSPHPETGKVEHNLQGAREILDVLAMLRDRTRGNLTDEEDKIFSNVLADLRLRYVEASKQR